MKLATSLVCSVAGLGLYVGIMAAGRQMVCRIAGADRCEITTLADLTPLAPVLKTLRDLQPAP